MIQEDNILVRIRGRVPYLRPALKRIAEYVLANADTVKIQKIKEVAAASQVSEATVTCFVREIGMDSFQGLKIAMAEAGMVVKNSPERIRKEINYDILKTDSIETIIDKITFQNLETLKNTKALIFPTEIEKAVCAIEKAGILAIYCAGTSTVAGQNAKSRFYRVGKSCLLYTDATEQAISASSLNRKCVALGITSSGRTIAVVNALKIAKEAGATTICITDSSKSPIVSYSDIQFFTASRFSSFLQDSMTSRMPQILIIDVLFACFTARNFSQSIKYIGKSTAAIKDRIFYNKGSKMNGL